MYIDRKKARRTRKKKLDQDTIWRLKLQSPYVVLVYSSRFICDSDVLCSSREPCLCAERCTNWTVSVWTRVGSSDDSWVSWNNSNLLRSRYEWLSVHNSAGVGDYWLLNDLNWLNNVLFMLNFHWNLIGNIHAAFHHLDDFARYGVWSWYLNNLLNDFLLEDLLANGHLAGNGHLYDLFHNAFNWIWNIACYDLFHWDRHTNFLWNSDFVWLWEWSVYDLHNFPLDWIWDWALNNLVHRVWHTNLFGHTDLEGCIHALLYNSSDGVRYWDFDDLVHRVWLWALNNLRHWVGNLNWLWNSDFVRGIHTSLHYLGNWVGNRSVYKIGRAHV